MKRLDVLPARPEMLPQRIGMAALATAAILLPLASVTQFGFTASASLASDSSLAWAMPIAFIAGIALSRNGADENWAKIADLAAAALAVGFLVYSALDAAHVRGTELCFPSLDCGRILVRFLGPLDCRRTVPSSAADASLRIDR